METLKKIRVSKEEGMNRRNTGDFQGSETTLYDMIIIKCQAWHSLFDLKPMECTSRVSPNAHCGC